MNLVDRLNENIIADAFAARVISDGSLAERLIRERKQAAERIAELEAALQRYLEDCTNDECELCKAARAALTS